MSVRSYTPYKYDEEVSRKRGLIDRSNKQHEPTVGSKTQRRKQNLETHKLNRRSLRR